MVIMKTGYKLGLRFAQIQITSIMMVAVEVEGGFDIRLFKKNFNFRFK
jgi:hypothetical protein